MPALYEFMKDKGATKRLLFINPFVSELGIIDKPDTKKVIKRFAEKLKIPKENIYFDEIGTITKKISRSGVFKIAKRLGTLLIFPTILVIDKNKKVKLALEGPPKNFLKLIDEAI